MSNRTLQDTDDRFLTVLGIIVLVLFTLGVVAYMVISSIECDHKCAPKLGVFARQVASYQCICVDPEDVK